MPAPMITKSGRPLSEKDLDAIEDKLGASLPASYRRFLRAHNGGNPEPSAWGRNNSVQVFFGFKPRMRMYDLFVNQQTLREWLPPPLLPIACGPFGDAFCLAIKGKNRGKVYFWDHEGGAAEEDPWLKFRHLVYPDKYEKATNTKRTLDWPGHPDLTLIADSFDEFLESFHDIDEKALLAEAKKTQAKAAPVRKAAPRKTPSATQPGTKKPAAKKPTGTPKKPAATKEPTAAKKKPAPKRPAATKRTPRGRRSK